MSEETIILLSDDNSDSEASKISSKPATSSNKSSTFPAEHNSYNEETPLKNPCWTMDIKKEVLETIKKFHFKCGNEHYEHLYILPSRWLCLLKFETIGEEIYANLQNAYCTPPFFFV